MKKILLAMTILGISLYATPIVLNNMGLITKLEKFPPICTYYSNIIKQPQHIRQQCKNYKNRLDDILKRGYRLDRNIVPQQHTHLYNGKMHTCTDQSDKETSYNPKVLKNYRTHLLALDKLRNQIVEDISREKAKARRSYDVAYHEKLIREDIIRLYDSDRTFIAEHRDVYANADNPRYIKMVNDKNAKLLSQKEREHLAMQRKKEERKKAKEYAKWMEKCGYNMTSDRFNAKKGGKLTGRVIGSQPTGYMVQTLGGSTFFVYGGPHHTKGEYISSPIYVISYGEVESTIDTNSRGVKTTSTAYVVHYNDACANQ